MGSLLSNATPAPIIPLRPPSKWAPLCKCAPRSRAPGGHVGHWSWLLEAGGPLQARTDEGPVTQHRAAVSAPMSSFPGAETRLWAPRHTSYPLSTLHSFVTQAFLR